MKSLIDYIILILIGGAVLTAIFGSNAWGILLFFGLFLLFLGNI